MGNQVQAMATDLHLHWKTSRLDTVAVLTPNFVWFQQLPPPPPPPALLDLFIPISLAIL